MPCLSSASIYQPRADVWDGGPSPPPLPPTLSQQYTTHGRCTAMSALRASQPQSSIIYNQRSTRLTPSVIKHNHTIHHSTIHHSPRGHELIPPPPSPSRGLVLPPISCGPCWPPLPHGGRRQRFFCFFRACANRSSSSSVRHTPGAVQGVGE
jgi:hypothetical protein